MEPLKLSAPWTTFYREMCALFGQDKDIQIFYEENRCILKLFCANDDKAEALASILPLKKEWGNVAMHIYVVPANENDTKITQVLSGFVTADVFKRAFAGNPVFSDAQTINSDFVSNPFTFVEFIGKPAQFFNDDTSSLYGISTILFEDVAREIFELNGVFFSTELLSDIQTVNPLTCWTK